MSGRTPLSPDFRKMLYDSHYQMRFALTKMDREITVEQGVHLFDWLAHLMITQGLRPLTVKKYCDILTEYYRWLNDHEIAILDVTPRLVDDWNKHLFIERNLGSSTRMQSLTAVRRYFSWREVIGLGSSPARNIKGPKRQRKLPRKFKLPELRALFATCEEPTVINIRDRAIMLLMYSTGARREEVINLDLGQVFLQERVGTVNFIGKGAKERVVSFEGPPVDALRRWMVELDKIKREDVSAVFVSVKKGLGTRPQNNWLDTIFKKRARIAKVKQSTAHMMRVTFATDLYDQGEDIEIIQQLMGHEDIRTTRGYIVITERQQKVRMKTSRINQVLGESGSTDPLWVQQKLKIGEFSEQRN